MIINILSVKQTRHYLIRPLPPSLTTSQNFSLVLHQTRIIARPHARLYSYALSQACLKDDGDSTTNSNARIIRVIKIFRILRIARILKLVHFIVCVPSCSS